MFKARPVDQLTELDSRDPLRLDLRPHRQQGMGGHVGEKERTISLYCVADLMVVTGILVSLRRCEGV